MLDRLTRLVDETGRWPYATDPAEARLAQWVRRVSLGAGTEDVQVRVREVLAGARRRMKPYVRPRRPRPAGSVAYQAECVERVLAANRRRSAAAAARTVDEARGRLASPLPLLDRHRVVLRARVEHPGESLRELAVRCGMSRNVYSGLLQRALAHRVGAR